MKHCTLIVERHYLTCQDENCEDFCCVARRDYERKISNLESKIEVVRKRLVDIRAHDLFCGVNMCGHKQTDLACLDAIKELE